jgi:hypothetical protein
VVLFFLSSPRFRFLSSCTCNFELSHRLVIHVNPHWWSILVAKNIVDVNVWRHRRAVGLDHRWVFVT